MPVRLLIVTPSNLLGDVLARALTSVDDFEILDICADLGPNTQEKAGQSDIVLLDSRFPEPPLEFISTVRDRVPGARIVVVQEPEFPRHVLPYIEAGAVGHVQDTDSLFELVAVLRIVQKGGAVINPDLANLVIDQMIELSRETGSPLSPIDVNHDLTERELEVLEVVAEGIGNAEIGERLYIQEGTVKNHIHNILRKLDLRDRGQAALWYSQWQRMQNAEPGEPDVDDD